MYVCLYRYVYINIYIYIYIYIYAYMNMCKCMYMSIYIANVCINAYIDIQCDLLEALGLESLLHPLLVLARARRQLRVQLAQHLDKVD